MLVAVIGSALGIASGYGLQYAIATYTAKGAEMGLGIFWFMPEVILLWCAVVALAFLACLLPAWQACRTDIQHTLTHG